MHKVLKIRQNGLLFGGPPCSSWVFINAGSHKRTRESPEGDTTRSYISSANRFLDMTSFRQ